jgi:hypothetical protein
MDVIEKAIEFSITPDPLNVLGLRKTEATRKRSEYEKALDEYRKLYRKAEEAGLPLDLLGYEKPDPKIMAAGGPGVPGLPGPGLPLVPTQTASVAESAVSEAQQRNNQLQIDLDNLQSFRRELEAENKREQEKREKRMQEQLRSAEEKERELEDQFSNAMGRGNIEEASRIEELKREWEEQVRLIRLRRGMTDEEAKRSREQKIDEAFERLQGTSAAISTPSSTTTPSRPTGLTAPRGTASPQSGRRGDIVGPSITPPRTPSRIGRTVEEQKRLSEFQRTTPPVAPQSVKKSGGAVYVNPLETILFLLVRRMRGGLTIDMDGYADNNKRNPIRRLWSGNTALQNAILRIFNEYGFDLTTVPNSKRKQDLMPIVNKIMGDTGSLAVDLNNAIVREFRREADRRNSPDLKSKFRILPESALERPLPPQSENIPISQIPFIHSNLEKILTDAGVDSPVASRFINSLLNRFSLLTAAMIGEEGGVDLGRKKAAALLGTYMTDLNRALAREFSGLRIDTHNIGKLILKTIFQSKEAMKEYGLMSIADKIDLFKELGRELTTDVEPAPFSNWDRLTRAELEQTLPESQVESILSGHEAVRTLDPAVFGEETARLVREQDLERIRRARQRRRREQGVFRPAEGAAILNLNSAEEAARFLRSRTTTQEIVGAGRFSVRNEDPDPDDPSDNVLVRNEEGRWRRLKIKNFILALMMLGATGATVAEIVKQVRKTKTTVVVDLEKEKEKEKEKVPPTDIVPRKEEEMFDELQPGDLPKVYVDTDPVKGGATHLGKTSIIEKLGLEFKIDMYNETVDLFNKAISSRDIQKLDALKISLENQYADIAKAITDYYKTTAREGGTEIITPPESINIKIPDYAIDPTPKTGFAKEMDSTPLIDLLGLQDALIRYNQTVKKFNEVIAIGDMVNIEKLKLVLERIYGKIYSVIQSVKDTQVPESIAPVDPTEEVEPEVEAPVAPEVAAEDPDTIASLDLLPEEKKSSDGYERAEAIDPAEAKLFLQSKQEALAEMKRWNDYSYVAPGHGLGGPRRNGLQRENLRSEWNRFNRPFPNPMPDRRTLMGLKAYPSTQSPYPLTGEGEPLAHNVGFAATPPTNAQVLSDMRAKPINQPQSIPIYQNAFGDDKFEDSFKNTYIGGDGEVMFTNPYLTSNRRTEWDSRNSIYHPDHSLYYFEPRAVAIGETSQDPKYRWTGKRENMTGSTPQVANAMYGFSDWKSDTLRHDRLFCEPMKPHTAAKAIPPPQSAYYDKIGSTRF